jgi:hypothetical protein
MTETADSQLPAHELLSYSIDTTVNAQDSGNRLKDRVAHIPPLAPAFGRG